MRINIKSDIVGNDEAWIYRWYGIDCVTPKNVLSALDEARKNNNERVDIYINSGGGDIFAASEIYSALIEYEGEVMIHIVGLAASAASVIACAGVSEIAPTAMLMIHNVSAQTRGDYNAMEHSAEMLKKANLTISAAYRAKTGKTDDELLDLMNRETWFTADEAVSLGFVDKHIDTSKVRLVAADSRVLSLDTLEKMKSVARENEALKKQNSHYKNYIELKEKSI
ncbi:MAG: Clp protease ClpP [Clostridia bacterium]|nr:Clp protease ClpP [Clostridia bacterium]